MMIVEQNFVLLSTDKQTVITKSAPVFICSAFCNRCNISDPSVATQTISDKEIKKVIPADFFRTGRIFYFCLCPLYKDCVLSFKQRGVIISSWLLMILLQSISLDLEITAIFSIMTEYKNV